MITEMLNNVIDEKSVQKIMPQFFKKQIAEHLYRLEGEDRRLRFGYAIKNDAIDRYVDRMTEKDIIFAIFDLDMQIIALAHFSLLNDGTAELGLSVNKDNRGQSFGSKLFHRALITAKILGIKEVFVQCLIDNKVMQHLAKKHKMKLAIHYSAGEAEGRLEVEPPMPIEIVEHALTQHVTLYDFAFKANMSALRSTAKIIRGE